MSDTTPQVPDDGTDGTDAGPLYALTPLSDDHDDNLTTLLAKRQHAKPNRATWVLLTLIVLAAGFIGGAFVQKTWGTSSSSTGGLPDFAALGSSGGFPGTGSAGTGSAGSDGSGTNGTFGGGFGGGATFGTVKLVDGSTLYLTDSNGNTVTVKVPDTATVTSQETVKLSDLAAGDTVIVRGETADDGTVTAQSVSAGAVPQGSGGAGVPPGNGSTPSASPTATTQGDN